MPKISIIMGVYNGENRLEKSVKSIINQTFEDWEFIICDDGSKDNSYEKLLDISKNDKRIVVLKNEKNMGLQKTLNKCLEKSRGNYIARMDDDDYSHENRLKIQYEFLENNKKYSIVGTSRNMYDNNGIWGKEILDGERTIVDILKGNSFIHPSVLIRKNDLITVGGYTDSKKVTRIEDLDLWFKLYYNGFVGFNLKTILLDYFEDNSSFKKRKFINRLNESLLKIHWFFKLKIKLKYFLWVFRPILVAFIPRFYQQKYHKKRFS